MTDDQTSQVLRANKLGFVNHVLASGKSEDEALAIYEKAASQNARRETLAQIILDGLK